MGPRYLAILRGAPSQSSDAGADIGVRAEQRCGLRRLYDSGDLTVFAEPGAPHIMLGQGRGLVLGNLFAGVDPATRLLTLDHVTGTKILATAGAHLVASHWGGYVALLDGEGASTQAVIRDPSATMPCYYTRSDKMIIVASDVALLEAAAQFVPEFDWGYIAGHLLNSNLRPARTAFAGLTELLGGFRLEHDGDGPRLIQIWSPWRYAGRDDLIRDESEAVARLRATTIGCVRGWASLFDHIILDISGGIDSSIVAACLRRSGVRTSCITLATDDAAGDERPFARILAAALDMPLEERFESVGLVDIARSDAAHLPRPIARSFAQSGDRARLDHATRTGADAFFSGGGGDNIFCNMQSAAPIADRLLVDGVGRGAWRTAGDMSVLTGCSLWAAITRGARRAWWRAPTYHWPTYPQFLTAQAISAATMSHVHPWLALPPKALPGKAAHVAWVMGIQNHLEGYHRELHHPVLSPLMSQPLIELCLRIPTWMWCAGGENRATARKAFAGDLPPAILNRRLKGTPASFVMQILEVNRSAVRDLLLDGLLARQGIIEEKKVSAFLADPRPFSGVDYMHVMALVDTEAWLRAWTDRTQPSLRHHRAMR